MWLKENLCLVWPCSAVHNWLSVTIVPRVQCQYFLRLFCMLLLLAPSLCKRSTRKTAENSEEHSGSKKIKSLRYRIIFILNLLLKGRPFHSIFDSDQIWNCTFSRQKFVFQRVLIVMQKRVVMCYWKHCLLYPYIWFYHCLVNISMSLLCTEFCTILFICYAFYWFAHSAGCRLCVGIRSWIVTAQLVCGGL